MLLVDWRTVCPLFVRISLEIRFMQLPGTDPHGEADSRFAAGKRCARRFFGMNVAAPVMASGPWASASLESRWIGSARRTHISRRLHLDRASSISEVKLGDNVPCARIKRVLD